MFSSVIRNPLTPPMLTDQQADLNRFKPVILHNYKLDTLYALLEQVAVCWACADMFSVGLSVDVPRFPPAAHTHADHMNWPFANSPGSSRHACRALHCSTALITSPTVED